MTDIDICRKYKKEDIRNIAKKINLEEEDLILYGNDKAKIKKEISKSKGKLILVTAISPTPYGEGKTTVSIGLNDALCSIRKNSIAVLREPSMGPVFGMKGGATGGGYSQVVPMEDINLHFTGDFHAITAVSNLLGAAIDNHIFQGNKLDIDTVVFKRAVDTNDRALRKVALAERNENFVITAASEVMAVFCLAESLEDLKRRIGNIIIGYNRKNEVVLARDLKIEGALTVLLKDAFLPNLVQSLEGNPVIIHGGPFANIAHGCNSVVATRLGLGISDYVVTEAGFGADLGAEKFYNIKCRKAKLKPDCTVLVATIKALKYHGGVSKEKIFESNNEALKKGLGNLERHYNNLAKFGKNIVVCLNKYGTDKDEEIELVREFCSKKKMAFAVSDSYSRGGKGAVELAQKVVELCDLSNNFKLLYDDNLSIKEKIDMVCKKIYGAEDVLYSEVADKKIEKLQSDNCSKFPICIAKTQYSFSDDKNLIGSPEGFNVRVRDIEVYNGAEFITVLLGNIMTMPGLPSSPNYERIDIDDGKIVGIE